MVTHLREKIALLVFSFLVIAALLVFANYLVAGHSWNKVATAIDDAFGDMEGYVVLLYEGSGEEDAGFDDELEPEAAVSADLDEQSAPVTVDEGGGVLEGADGEVASDSADAEFAPAAVEPVSAEAYSEPEEEGIAALAKRILPIPGEDRPAPSPEALREEYEEKGASPFVLETDRLDKYANGVTLRSGDSRIGVVSVEDFISPADFERFTDRFRERGVDYIVVLTSNVRFLSLCSGADVVISTKDTVSRMLGESRDGTFYVSVPAEGSVGVTMISPSNNASAKVVEG